MSVDFVADGHSEGFCVFIVAMKYSFASGAAPFSVRATRNNCRFVVVRVKVVFRECKATRAGY